MKSIELQMPLYVKFSLCSIGFCAFVTILYTAQHILLPIIYSSIIAIILSPSVNYFEKKTGRILAITIILLVFLIITILLISLLSSQMMQFSNAFPKLNQQFNSLINEMVLWVSSHFKISTERINVWITEKNIVIVNEASATIAKTIINTGSLLIVFILMLVYTFMILYYQPLLSEFIKKLFKSAERAEINEILTATRKVIRSYLIGLLLEALIVASLNASLLLILGIDYAILLGVIGALVNVIPFIGGVISISLPILMALATKSPSYALLVLIGYLIIQFTDNHFIIPKVVASKVQINALVSIVVVLIGGALWGIPGMFLSIPITAIVKLIFDRIDTLKPWGYLLGDTMPVVFKYPFLKKTIL